MTVIPSYQTTRPNVHYVGTDLLLEQCNILHDPLGVSLTDVPVMAAVAVKKKVVSIGHLSAFTKLLSLVTAKLFFY